MTPSYNAARRIAATMAVATMALVGSLWSCAGPRLRLDAEPAGASARQFMAYVGLVPSEWSSGPSRHRGRITKTGNRLIRHVLGQAAHNARHRPNVSAGLRARQRHVPPEVVALDRKAQARLHHRYRTLVGRIGLNKTVIATARELAGFVWAAGQLVAPRAA